MRCCHTQARWFKDATREWRKITLQAMEHCKMSELLRRMDLPIVLADMNRTLDNVHKGVMEYLELKRGHFPRFYFLSNNEMVNMLVK